MDMDTIEKRIIASHPNMTPEEYEKWQRKIKAGRKLEELMKIPPIFKFPDNDPDYKKAREIIYRERGLIP
jgi:hypothetical protein